jgi:hypothetical protein
LSRAQDLAGEALEVSAAPRGSNGPAAQKRQANRKRLVQAIRDAGFRQDRRNSNVYHHKDLPAFRLVFRDTVLRFEVRKPNTHWTLARSYLLTRDIDAALKELRLRPVAKIADRAIKEVSYWSV